MKDRQEKIRELQKRLADLKKRQPAHSVQPWLVREMEEIEEELEKLQEEKPKT